MIATTALYGGLLGLFYIALSFRVIGMRRETRVSLGHGDHTGLERRMRGHANFAEYAPITLILMAIAEVSGAAHWAIHAAGLALIIGRALHGALFGWDLFGVQARISGMLLTFASLFIASCACVWVALSGLS